MAQGVAGRQEAAHVDGPKPQLLAMCQPARQRTDALVRTQDHQTRQQPRQFRVATSVVPVVMGCQHSGQ